MKRLIKHADLLQYFWTPLCGASVMVCEPVLHNLRKSLQYSTARLNQSLLIIILYDA